MIFAGIDIGSRGAKAVVMKDTAILSQVIRDTGPESVKTSYMVLDEVLKGTGLTLKDIRYTIATGYGRVLVPFANDNISEISCHARGVSYYFPSVRTILDMGGQDCKAISCDGEGRVTNFVMNDKCAGGTGRFLEMIADVLSVPLVEVGDVSLSSKTAISFNTICAVFAKSEALLHQRRGVPKSDILAGLHDAISVRCYNLLKRVGIAGDFTITGGIAKNKGMVAKIRDRVGLEPLLAPDPQIIGALGAAIFARERYSGGGATAELKIHYGYNDATGNYFVTVDTARCDGCGECVPVCPAQVLEVVKSEANQPKASVKESARKKLAYLCPGIYACRRSRESTCHSACKKDALSHSW